MLFFEISISTPSGIAIGNFPILDIIQASFIN
jgi:hypothetical protein